MRLFVSLPACLDTPLCSFQDLPRVIRYVPLGYDVKDRKLVVNEGEAATVRGIFERFVEVGSATVLARELRRKGIRNKKGTLVDKGYLYRVLVNRGDAVHKCKAYPGEHQATIDAQLWDQVHAILRQNPRKRANNTRAQAPALLKGLIFTAMGAAMTPSSTKKGARRYRYYVSMDASGIANPAMRASRAAFLPTSWKRP
jgi:site-specific DNA recombinase